MSFVSIDFFFFFPIVTVIYFALPHRFRWVWLLLASCIFYMAFIPGYIFILLGLIIIDYTAARLLERVEGTARTYILLASILSVAGTLFVFKYFNFFNENFSALASFLGWQYPIAALSLALPIGLSFHTFQSLSYVIEVYRKKFPAERHFGIYALYVMFYPQLVAGPIERPQQLLPQFHEKHHFHYERVKNGLIRMVWGFFKKMVVADHLALVVDRVYGHPETFSGLALLIATVFFTLQLYFDFSAYCDIALGAAQVMGFKLMENFNLPFASKSMSEFWHRWHISLSSWFRDYFYYPLLFSQKNKTARKMYAAILFTFLVTGFWHGANWTFGIFGLLHGTYIVFGTWTQPLRKRFGEKIGLPSIPRTHRALQAVIIFACAAFACIFFRAQHVQDGLYIAGHIFSGYSHWFSLSYIVQTIHWIATSTNSFLISCFFAILVLWCEYISRDVGLFATLAQQKWYVRWMVYWAMLWAIVILSQNTSSQFIYFQF